MAVSDEFADKAQQIIEAGRFLNQRGWVPATSSNFSMRLSDGSVAVTVSGYHKGALSAEAVMRVDGEGNSLDGRRPSAETLLHTSLYNRFADVGAVLHTHSVNATVLSRLSEGELVFEDYELQKAFSGVTTHEGRHIVPIFANDQDIPRLAAEVECYMDDHAAIHGYLIE
ncbi:MAG: methylthioribulose 1-phosphate dehydratase, partial [Chromatiales bacterium]|nr:methylthioribulose 1-phosphate dehydratase [Chromatiales bacterium]